VFLDEVIYPEARTACEMVSKKMERGEFEDLTTFEPFYLKEYMFKN
jgi:tRNA threonylcarbamoyladenosine biosynthesis protein TsaB